MAVRNTRKHINTFNKKLLVVVFAAAVLIGITAQLLQQTTNRESTNPAPNTNTEFKSFNLTPSIDTNSAIFPKSIKKSMQSAEEDLDNTEKATFTLSYANRTDSDLTNIQLLLRAPTGSGLEFTNRVDARLNEAESRPPRDYVFDLPTIKSGGIKYVSLYVYGSTPGSYVIQGRVRSSAGDISNIEPFTIIIR